MNTVDWEKIFTTKTVAPTVKELQDLSGEYAVRMLENRLNFPFNFVRFFMNLFHDKKIFQQGKGYNSICGIKWGHFSAKVVKRIVLSGDDDPIWVGLIDYDVEENFITRRISDYIRRLENGQYLGRFTWEIGRRRYFGGYFTLTKIEK